MKFKLVILLFIFLISGCAFQKQDYSHIKKAPTVIVDIEPNFVKDKTAKLDKKQFDFNWPLSKKIVKVTSEYGWRFHPLFKARRYHTGIDLTAGNSEIIAAQGGVVKYSGWAGGYGLTIMIKHKNGLSTIYARCAKLRFEIGQKVKKGEVIANIGNSGTSIGPHCHFEIRKGNIVIDPMVFLKKRKKLKSSTALYYILTTD